MNISRFAVCTLLAAASAAAAAQEAGIPVAEPETEMAVGIAAGYSREAYRSYSGRVSAIPAVQFENRRFYLRGLSGGVKLYTAPDHSQELLLGASYRAAPEFKPSRTDDARLKILDRRKSSLAADLAYHLYTPLGNVETQISQDLSNHSRGTRIQAQYSYFWQVSPAFALKPAAGAAYSSRRFNRYYYGISAAEAACSGLEGHAPSASLQPYAAVSAEYRFAPQIKLFANLRAERLADSVKNSPLAGRSYRLEAATGVQYRF